MAEVIFLFGPNSLRVNQSRARISTEISTSCTPGADTGSCRCAPREALALAGRSLTASPLALVCSQEPLKLNPREFWEDGVGALGTVPPPTLALAKSEDIVEL